MNNIDTYTDLGVKSTRRKMKRKDNTRTDYSDGPVKRNKIVDIEPAHGFEAVYKCDKCGCWYEEDTGCLCN